MVNLHSENLPPGILSLLHASEPQKRNEREERSKRRPAAPKQPAEQSVKKQVTQTATSDGQSKEEAEMTLPKPAREKKED